jgi:hypothetical protein
LATAIEKAPMMPRSQLRTGKGGMGQPQFKDSLVIPKRGCIARGICCFAATTKQIPRAIQPRFGITRERSFCKLRSRNTRHDLTD